MKMIKTILWLFLSMVVLAVLAGCVDYNGPYPFRQELSNVTNVEICEFDPDNNGNPNDRKLIVQLSDSDAQNLISELSAMNCGKFSYLGRTNNTHIGLLAICITYGNGDMELIGLSNIYFITSDGKKDYTSYHFESRELYDLIAKYVDPELLPDMRSQYPHWFS